MKKFLLIFFVTINFATFGQFFKWNELFDGGDTTTVDEVEHYNAKGDGVTDDYAALYAAINSSQNLTGTLNFASGKTYLISQPLYPLSNTTWNATGATIKLAGGDSSLLTRNFQRDSFVVVAEPSKFSVGQWIGVVDDSSAFSSGNLLRYGYADSISKINGDTIFFARARTTGNPRTTTQNGRAGHIQSVIIAEGIDNWTLNGGTIDANGFSTNQIMIHPVMTYGGNGELLQAGTGISIMGCTNITLNGTNAEKLNVINGVTHNIVTASFQGLGATNSEDVRLNYLNLNKARMKNLWVRETDTLTVNVAYCDSALREDGIAFYTNAKVMTVDSAFITKYGRYGLLFNGGACDSLNATKIFCTDKLLSTSIAMSLQGTDVWVTDAEVDNTIRVSNLYGGTDDIYLTDVTIDGSNNRGIEIIGEVGDVLFDNVVINNCTNTAIYIDTTITAGDANNGFPQRITFKDGGITNLDAADSVFHFTPPNTVNGSIANFTFDNWDGLESETAKYIAVDGFVADSQITNVNDFVAMLKDSLGSSALSTDFNVFYIFAHQDSVISKKNLVDVTTYEAVNVDTMNFTLYEGWNGEALPKSNWLNTGFIPSTAGSPFTQNSASMGIYSRTNNQTSGSDCGTSGSGVKYFLIKFRANATESFGSVNADALADFGSSPALTSSLGLLSVSRTAADTTKGFYNGLKNALTSPQVSSGLSTVAVCIGTNNNNGTPGATVSVRQYAMFFIGRGFNEIEMRRINNCMEFYMDSIGKGVQ